MKQEDRINEHKKDGDTHFTEEGRVAQITIDFVLQARVKMADETQGARGFHCDGDDKAASTGKLRNFKFSHSPMTVNQELLSDTEHETRAKATQ